MQLRYGPEPRRAFRAPAADRRPREADPQGELRPGRRRSTSSTSPRRCSSAFTALAAFAVIPFGRRLGDRRLPRQRRRRRRPDLADPDLRARLARDLRLHRRRLGVRLEVLAARLDADVRAARLVRGLARALRARRRAHGQSLSLAEIVDDSRTTTGGTSSRSRRASSCS